MFFLEAFCEQICVSHVMICLYLSKKWKIGHIHNVELETKSSKWFVFITFAPNIYIDNMLKW